MNLYARTEDGFSEEDEALGGDLAAAAGSVLSNVSAYWTAFDLSQQLNEAMASRAVIEQARGILTARYPQLGADDAFGLLRNASGRQPLRPPPGSRSSSTWCERTILEIAHRIIEQHRTSR